MPSSFGRRLRSPGAALGCGRGSRPARAWPAAFRSRSRSLEPDPRSFGRPQRGSGCAGWAAPGVWRDGEPPGRRPGAQGAAWWGSRGPAAIEGLKDLRLRIGLLEEEELRASERFVNLQSDQSEIFNIHHPLTRPVPPQHFPHAGSRSDLRLESARWRVRLSLRPGGAQ